MKFVVGLIRREARVILEAPKPVFKSPPFRCSDWFNRYNPDCSLGFLVQRRDIDERRSAALAVEQGMAVTTKGVSVWDPTPVLCDAATCNAFYEDRPLFFDGDHLSGFGNDVLYRSFHDHVMRDLHFSGRQ
jgi:hypothetical protein